MIKKLLGVVALSSTFMLAACGSDGGSSSSEDFPNKNIQILVPYAAGGGTDTLARQFAELAKNSVGSSVSVQNVEGGGGAVGMQKGTNAKKDGYTVTMTTVELLTLPNSNLAQFTYEDFTPVALLNSDPGAITVKADAPWNTIEEFLAEADKTNLKIGNSGTGAIWHLAAAALGKEVGKSFNYIPFEGAAPAVTAVLGGHIDAVSVSPAEVINQVNAGELKVLAVMADERVDSLPDVPTFKEKGIDLSIGTWRGLAVPKDTPEDIVKTLEEKFGEVAKSDDFKAQVEKLNLGYKYMNTEELYAFWEEQNKVFEELIPTLKLN
ncbi:ABC transporter substrate-binding protein [Lysinibacillus sp. 2017]|uniref:tripartite tricarboxylate transporter substrate binding protein n=1 Tax=unclassified Lysinibacillus TaxID=2636778 RepID=UPI000D528EC3|nr:MULTISPECIES: tripartite tricarboxylate transporter substrate binding protein [unclassified Lysinibacillus]AWE07745.1 ABC transporter substrate-binding protein [Lysinibacillus sp. 2017]TGN32315.1 tripartite tricarboxylate transporter substrate binding protein [Lysinibacillus sp. S2017]